jgi:hypothetical protein
MVEAGRYALLPDTGRTIQEIQETMTDRQKMAEHAAALFLDRFH